MSQNVIYSKIALFYMMLTIQINFLSAEEVFLDSQGRNYVQTEKGMLSGGILMLSNEPAVNIASPNFKFRLIIDNYSGDSRLILRLTNDNNIIVKRYTYNSNTMNFSLDLFGEVAMSENRVKNILAGDKKQEFASLLSLSNKARNSWADSMYTFEYFFEGEYYVLDWSNLSVNYLDRMKADEKKINNLKFSKLVKSVESYRILVNKILAEVKFKKI